MKRADFDHLVWRFQLFIPLKYNHHRMMTTLGATCPFHLLVGPVFRQINCSVVSNAELSPLTCSSYLGTTSATQGMDTQVPDYIQPRACLKQRVSILYTVDTG